MIAGSYAGHVSGNRKQFANILSKAAPYVFLPFFTLTGVSLQLDEVRLRVMLFFVLFYFSIFDFQCLPIFGCFTEFTMLVKKLTKT